MTRLRELCPVQATVGAQVIRLALVLCVGCPPEVFACFRGAGAELKLLVRRCEAWALAEAIRRWQPLSIVLMREADLGPASYDAMARWGGTSLVVTDGRVSSDEAAVVLINAVAEGWMLRQQALVTSDSCA